MGAASAAAVASGDVSLTIADPAPVASLARAGKLKVLATTAARRVAAFPEVPTMAEAGIKGSIPEVWWVLMTPRGTAPAVVARLNAEIGTMMKNPDLQERFAQLGITPLHSTPERVTELIRLETPAIGKALKAAGIEPE